MEDTKAAGGNGSGRLRGVDAPSCCLTADQLYLLVFNEVIEGTDGIGTAAYTSQHGIRKPAFLLNHLRLDLFGDNRLEISYDGREGMRSHAGSQYIVGILNAVGPLPHSLRYSVL